MSLAQDVYEVVDCTDRQQWSKIAYEIDRIVKNTPANSIPRIADALLSLPPLKFRLINHQNR